MRSSNPDAPDVKVIPPLVYLGGIVIGALISQWLPTKVFPSAIAWPIGGVFMVAGALIASSAFWRFKAVGTTVRPDRIATTLVIKGPYRVTRNPMYLGLAVGYLGIAAALQSLWALILLPVVLTIIQRKVILREEAFLASRFGEDYVRYKASVRRWL